jgi:hypothetical protein
LLNARKYPVNGRKARALAFGLDEFGFLTGRDLGLSAAGRGSGTTRSVIVAIELETAVLLSVVVSDTVFLGALGRGGS